MLTLRCQLVAEDYVKAQYLHLRPSPWLKYCLLALVGFGFVVFTASLSSPPLLANLITGLIPLVFIAVIYAFIFFFILPRKTKRVFQQQKSLQMQYEMVITPEAIETRSENGITRMPLTDFYQYKVGKDMVLLYQSQALFHMFPRRFFASEEDFQTFLAYLKTSLSRPKS